MVTYTLKVVELRKETNDTVTVCFKQPLLKKVKYQAGQYLTLLFRINGRRYIRPYSFSSAPGIDAQLEVTVKRVPGGVVSNHICDRLQVGDAIEVYQPLGDFVVEEATIVCNKHIVLWGAGSGITPLFSIAKHTLATSDCKVTLVYGNRNYESVIFVDKIKELQKTYPHKFSVWHFHTQLVVEAEQPYLVQGRIKPEKVLSIVKAEGDVPDSVHYICGPPGLKESVKAALSSLNVPAGHVFSEDFELVKDENEIADIITRSVTIVKNAENVVVEVVKGKSILEAGLDANLELSYSCQTGNCSLCKGKVVSGAVRQAALVKERTDLAADEYLLCCAYPLADDVKILVE
ncbi:MAG: ferredoxin--NADP reductase [Segetibacter sp.]|nr:ferredoxin--NADP reductase [Segetibacter sp.]